MVSDADIVKTVETLAVETFSRAAIDSVRAWRHADQDGDAVIELFVLMRDGIMPLDPKMTLPFRSAVGRAVRERGETAYTALSFMPVSEYQQTRSEAA